MFYATNDFGSGAALMAGSQRWAPRTSRLRCRAADLVIAISEHLADGLPERGGVTPSVTENDVDQKASRPPTTHLLPSMSISIRRSPGSSGTSPTASTSRCSRRGGRRAACPSRWPRQGTFDRRIETLLARPNVQWVGAKPFGSLLSYMRLIDVGLLSYADREFNRSSFPLKILAYLAAGRPAVSTDLPAASSAGRWGRHCKRSGRVPTCRPSGARSSR
jgi:teichuronic acid biosynthesis glycosyltransferase TuaH